MKVLSLVRETELESLDQMSRNVLRFLSLRGDIIYYQSDQKTKILSLNGLTSRLRSIMN
jgi:hypothetical protein